MKKIIWILFIVIGFLEIQAQKKARFGLKSGWNISDISNLNSEKQNNFYVGGFVAIKLSKQFTLQPELNYSRQGAKLNDTNLDFLDEVEINYLSLSILAKVYIAKGLHLDFGQYLDVDVDDNLVHSDHFLYLPHFDLGFIGGIGIDFLQNFTLEARYKFGLIDVYDINSNDPYYYQIENKNTNQVIQLGLAYKIDY